MSSVVIETAPLGFPWATVDPFLFCVHHLDHYPAGNEKMAPITPLSGRNLGNDFVIKDGFRMYHGKEVPGFPQHPHRGFETVTIVRQGYIDHSDSLGAAARFGAGDVQWLTAGGGIVHSEMFPLIQRDAPNTGELFQIWLNLPAADKLAPPHFSMLWSASIPRCVFTDENGRKTEITVVAGSLDGNKAPAPPPHSWASRANAQVAIWCIKMQSGAKVTLPPSGDAAVMRTVYFFAGSQLKIADQVHASHQLALVESNRPLVLEAGDSETEILLLQGRPIAEPVVQYGPFVMNTKSEIQAAFRDYSSTGFGGWPWPSDDPVHARTDGRFARHADGSIERP
ncbi:MAG TPA: pirin family protein [Polyangiaceae bacterium]|nr:pirin family protein [Polyangiaceae bacterium]